MHKTEHAAGALCARTDSGNLSGQRRIRLCMQGVKKAESEKFLFLSHNARTLNGESFRTEKIN